MNKDLPKGIRRRGASLHRLAPSRAFCRSFSILGVIGLTAGLSLLVGPGTARGQSLGCITWDTEPDAFFPSGSFVGFDVGGGGAFPFLAGERINALATLNGGGPLDLWSLGLEFPSGTGVDSGPLDITTTPLLLTFVIPADTTAVSGIFVGDVAGAGSTVTVDFSCDPLAPVGPMVPPDRIFDGLFDPEPEEEILVIDLNAIMGTVDSTEIRRAQQAAAVANGQAVVNATKGVVKKKFDPVSSNESETVFWGLFGVDIEEEKIKQRWELDRRDRRDEREVREFERTLEIIDRLDAVEPGPPDSPAPPTPRPSPSHDLSGNSKAPVINDDGGFSSRLEFFTGGVFNRASFDPIRDVSDHHSDSYIGTAGVGYEINEHLSAGLVLTYSHNDTEFGGGTGSIDTEGWAVSPYLSWQKNGNSALLLYSAGWYRNDIEREAFPAGTARAEPDSMNQAVSLDLARRVLVRGGKPGKPRPFITGPVGSLNYLHGDLDGYTERGAGVFNTRTGDLTFDSLLSEIGWEVSLPKKTGWGWMMPYVRGTWDREWMNDEERVDVSLVTSPVSIFRGGRFAGRGGDFSLSADTIRPDDSYMTLATGVSARVRNKVDVNVGYQVQLFRDDVSNHFASCTVGWGF